jgi:hypothetical protein
MIGKCVLGICALLILGASCKQRADRNHASDSALIAAMDTTRLNRQHAGRLSRDEALLKKAASRPGINAGSGNFDIQTPVGWDRTDTSMDGVKATILLTASSDPRFHTNVNVVSESMNGLSPDLYEQATIDNLRKYLPQFALVGKGEQLIDSSHARWIEYTQNPGGIDLKNICYLVPDKDVVYIITCSALRSEFIRFQPQFDQAVSTFHLLH